MYDPQKPHLCHAIHNNFDDIFPQVESYLSESENPKIPKPIW